MCNYFQDPSHWVSQQHYCSPISDEQNAPYHPQLAHLHLHLHHQHVQGSTWQGPQYSAIAYILQISTWCQLHAYHACSIHERPCMDHMGAYHACRIHEQPCMDHMGAYNGGAFHACHICVLGIQRKIATLRTCPYINKPMLYYVRAATKHQTDSTVASTALMDNGKAAAALSPVPSPSCVSAQSPTQ